jgi:hypothetical protein
MPFIGDKLCTLARQVATGSVHKRQNRYTNSPFLTEKLTEREDRYLAARPNNRVFAGMRGRLAFVYLCADEIFLHGPRLAGQGRFDGEAKRSVKPVRSDKQRTL